MMSPCLGSGLDTGTFGEGLKGQCLWLLGKTELLSVQVKAWLK